MTSPPSPATAASGPAVAPRAPGRMGVALQPSEAGAFIDAMTQWLSERRRELDEVDQAALSGQVDVTSDLTLSMALWQAATERTEELRRTWDSGRVGMAEREKLSALVWGRLSTGSTTGPAVTLPEACRLSDALLAQLRERVGLDPSGVEIATRVRQLRAQLERIRDQVGLEPAGAAHQRAAEQQSRLARRLAELADKAQRGGDIGGLLGPLEIDAATFERDLIVSAARRRESAAARAAAQQQRATLIARASELSEVAARCVRLVDPAPRYAVPDVTALGEVPETAEAIATYVRRLDQVGRAVEVAASAYVSAVAEHEELSSRLEAYRAKASATGHDRDRRVARTYELASAVLAEEPARMVVARHLVAAFQAFLQYPPRSEDT